MASNVERFGEDDGFVVGAGVDVDSVVVCGIIDCVGYGSVIAGSCTPNIVGNSILG